MLISEYFEDIRNHILQFPFVVSNEIIEDLRTSTEGFIKARIIFIDGFELSYHEYVSTQNITPIRYSYSFHFFKNQTLIFRYDNAPNHKNISSYPHHKHLSDGSIVPCSVPTISSILSEIETFLITN